jgi:hypothetical protein
MSGRASPEAPPETALTAIEIKILDRLTPASWMTGSKVAGYSD